jgi:hypothetical protein
MRYDKLSRFTLVLTHVIYIARNEILPKIYSLVWIVVAFFLHLSALSFLLVPLFSLFRFKKNTYMIVLFFSFLIGILFKIEWIDLLLNIKILPDHYLYYIRSGRIQHEPVITWLTKFIFIPFYIFSITQLIDKNKLTTTEEKFFLVGFLSVLD